jgi:hypothetical protein
MSGFHQEISRQERLQTGMAENQVTAVVGKTVLRYPDWENGTTYLARCRERTFVNARPYVRKLSNQCLVIICCVLCHVVIVAVSFLPITRYQINCLVIFHNLSCIFYSCLINGIEWTLTRTNAKLQHRHVIFKQTTTTTKRR